MQTVTPVILLDTKLHDPRSTLFRIQQSPMQFTQAQITKSYVKLTLCIHSTSFQPDTLNPKLPKP